MKEKLTFDMYINFDILKSKGLNYIQYLILVAAKQNKIEDREETLAELLQDDINLESLIDVKLLSLIKGKKGQSEFKRLRITSKGTKLLEDISTPEITAGDIQMYDYLSEMYLKHEDEDRVLGNVKKTKMYCAVFRNYLSLSLHQMFWLCHLYLQDAIYTKKLENIFFDSNKNRYGSFKNNIEDSPLYQYYNQNKQKIERFWKNKEL